MRASHYSGYCLQVSYFHAQQWLAFLHISDAFLVNAVHLKMKQPNIKIVHFLPYFFLTVKILSQNISITLLQISLKLHEHRGGYWRKKLPWTILEEQFPVPRYTAASKIGNSVISLLWQLRCRCNPDKNKFSSLSNTTVVVIFPNLCLWRRSLCSNLGGIDPEKLYRAPQVLTFEKRFKVWGFCNKSSKWNNLSCTRLTKPDNLIRYSADQ